MPGRPASRQTFRILHHLARSGGTLISKCIACMHAVTLLSEVHPKGTAWTQATPKGEPVDLYGLSMQARQHALLTDAQLKQFRRRPMPFPSLIALLDATASARGDRLALRDWSHLDYTGYPWFAPTNTSGLAAALSPLGDVRRFSTTRHPIDQWLSLETLAIMRPKPGRAPYSPDAYLAGCAAFAQHAAHHGFVRYEDFTHDPATHLQTICTALDIPYDDAWRERWSTYDKITGDIAGTRGGREEIRPLTRRPADPALLERFRKNDDYTKVKDLLGYTDELD